MGTGVHPQGVKRPEHAADHLPPCDAQFLRAAVTYIFTAWQRKTLTSYLRLYGNPNTDHMRNDTTEKIFFSRPQQK